MDGADCDLILDDAIIEIKIIWYLRHAVETCIDLVGKVFNG
jgi:hypothetical protein